MNKSAALRIRIDPDLHQQFLNVCQKQDVPASQVLRQYMRSYVEQFSHGLQSDLFESATKVSNETSSNK